MPWLMYIILCTRLNISYAVKVAIKYQYNLKEEHWIERKHILKSLWKTRDFMLIYFGSEPRNH